MRFPRVARAGRVLSVTLALLLCVTALAGCKPKPPPNTLIAFLLGGEASTRWAEGYQPALDKRVTQTCRGCSTLFLDAGGDANLQAEQFDQAISQGADVIVINAVDSERAEELVLAAGKVPVIAFDRYVAGADYYVGYDAVVTGQLQADAVLAAAEGGSPSVLLIDGGRGDANTAAVRQGREQELSGKAQILGELQPEGGSAQEAATWAKEQLRKHKPDSVDAILAANDMQAGAVVDVLTDLGVKPQQFPDVTGQDADLTAVRRIVRGEQEMTVYKPIAPEADQAADVAVTLVTGGKVSGGQPVEGVPSFIFTPQAVTQNNLADTVVKDRLYTLEQICDAETLKSCQRLGLR